LHEGVSADRAAVVVAITGLAPTLAMMAMPIVVVLAVMPMVA